MTSTFENAPAMYKWYDLAEILSLIITTNCFVPTGQYICMQLYFIKVSNIFFNLCASLHVRNLFLFEFFGLGPVLLMTVILGGKKK